jgi:hypothetical protein
LNWRKMPGHGERRGEHGQSSELTICHDKNV